MPQYHYGIGVATPVTNLESLGTPVNPPRGTFAEWSVVRERGDGSTVGHGYPQVTWHFDYLTQDMVDQLRTFCPGKSAAIYIQTRLSSAGTWDEYSCIMHWPDDIASLRTGPGIYENVDILFTKLVVAP